MKKTIPTLSGQNPFCMMGVLGICLMAVGCGSIAARGHNAQGVRFYGQSRYEEANVEFQKALASDPKNADSYYNLATLAHRRATASKSQDDYKQAESYYNQCLDRNMDHVECYRGLAVLLAEQGYREEALRLIENWANRRPDSPDPRIELARLSQEFGNTPIAQEQLRQAIELDPDNPRALAALGKLREDSGEYEQALRNYQKCLYQDRQQPEIAARIASLQSKVGRLSGVSGNGVMTPAPTGSTPTPPGGTRVVTRQTVPVR